MKRLNLKRVLLTIGVVVLVSLVIGGAIFVVWGSTPPTPMAEAFTALESDAAVTVNSDGWITFTPTSTPPTTGLIFYPGGRVDARSYAPYARAIAEAGFLVVITPMPLNLAVLNLNAADAVIAAHPAITHWAIGGHSLGGAMAARYVHAHPEHGLVMWASYPDLDMSGYAETPMISIYGTLDGLATVATIDESRARMPAAAELVAIEGGNHAQFGWYGAQAGDNPATISAVEQQAQVVAATTAFLSRLGE